ncbi:protein kinase [Vitiosangium sp. GDMCC 1.1324]|uniref:protein kinase domain-containing protein n=1 Tax=Vitiosangium sp. (strain GDMCC 1.1324) TaxID=2138576 RepID=UPI0011B363FA|nr:protein kinase [Vitiosangium sp. GDMCC 1.1324]
MSKEVSRADEHDGLPTSLGLSFFGEGESEDSFLKEVLQVERAPRLPVPGERLGGSDGRRYTVLGWMGGGGMGQVFRARDEVLGREVALKFLVARQGLEGAVLSEARAVALLNHENIVRIFDVAEWRGTPGGRGIPFLVMECLEGESLAALLKRESLQVERALEILDGIAAGLSHAHERHLVHRDLKPANVFLTRQGTVKLLDFGLSHLTPSCVARRLELAMAGTPAYMAPEQWRGEPQDARTDIWAVGVMLHEMLTGRLPHPSATLEELRAWVTSDEPVPPVRARRPEVPQEVEALLSTALARDPVRRFRTALELRAELHELRARLRPGRETPRTSQRHQLTLMVFLLTGLTEGASSLDAEDVDEVALAFHEKSAEIIGQHGGLVALSMGGEVLACFGCPQRREADAERAVRAGLQLTRELRDTLQRKLPHLPLSGLSVRGGIHTEWVTVRVPEMGSPGGGRLAIQGDAPRVAEWLARQAGPGDVFLGETTWKLVRGAFLTESFGLRVFEGLSGSLSLEAHRVRGERRMTSRFDQSLVTGRLLPLVGREPELARLLDLWERAWRGQGSFVLVSGEAGIGKSRLIEELCERVAPESALLLRVQCWFRFSTHALHPASAILQEVVRFSPEESPPQRLRKLEARLREMGLSTEDTHLMGQFLSLPMPEDSPVQQLTPERRKQRIFEALARILLQRNCSEAPVLLVVEDLHWADSNQLEFLGFFLECIEQGRILVILSTRPELRPDWPRRPWFHPLTLERLRAGLAATLVKEAARGHALSEETVQRLVSRTDGIPLFIEEMTRMVLEGGAEDSIPVTLHELLLARLDLLPLRQRALAQLCAVVGRNFPRALIAALMDLEDAVLERELAGLVAAGLLQEEAGADGAEPGFRFRHALIQDAAYQSLSRSTRRQHHQRIARILEERFAHLVTMKPEMLAHHYTEAGDVEPAVHNWLRAGLLANQRWAIQEAVNHLTLALKLLPGLSGERQRLHAELRILSALSLPMAHLHGYGSPRLAQMLSRLRELFLEVGDALPQTDLWCWGIFAYSYARLDFPLTLSLVERLMDQGARHHNQELLSVGHRQMANVLLLTGRLQGAMERIDRAMTCARLHLRSHRRLATPQWTDPEATALGLASIIYTVAGRIEEAQAFGRSALKLAGRIHHVDTTAYALTYTAIACQLRREPGEVLRWADQALALACENSYWLWRSWSTLVRGWALSELGHPREGLAIVEQEIWSRRERGILVGVPHYYGMLAEIHLKLGYLGEGLDATRKALAELKATGECAYESELHRLYGELLRAGERECEAMPHFLRAIAVARHQGARLFELRATVDLGRLPRALLRALQVGGPGLASQLPSAEP